MNTQDPNDLVRDGILIGVPVEETMPTASAVSLLHLERATPDLVDWHLDGGHTTVAQKRNGIVRRLLDSEYAAVLFIDSDMTAPPETPAKLVQTMLETGADLVSAVTVEVNAGCISGGLVARSGAPKDPLRPASSDPDLERDGISPEGFHEAESPLRLDYAGTGCLLVHRRVFETLEEPWFVADAEGGDADYNFTLRATRAGFDLLLDPKVRTGHVRPKAYTLEDLRHAQESEAAASGPASGSA